MVVAHDKDVCARGQLAKERVWNRSVQGPYVRNTGRDAGQPCGVKLLPAAIHQVEDPAKFVPHMPDAEDRHSGKGQAGFKQHPHLPSAALPPVLRNGMLVERELGVVGCGDAPGHHFCCLVHHSGLDIVPPPCQGVDAVTGGLTASSYVRPKTR